MADRLDGVLAWLGAQADPVLRGQLAERYGIHTDLALGVPMRDLKAYARTLGADHELAEALWSSGGYEARTLAALVDDPAAVSVGQMDRWAADFDNWAICDTVCFHLFDRTVGAWSRVPVWAADEREFVRRASLALVWALALHDRAASDQRFAEVLSTIEEAAFDERPFVNKAVIMALGAIAAKRAALVPDVRAVADRLVAADGRAAVRAGRAVLRKLPG